MDLLRRSRPFAAWLAALAVLLGALAPATAQVVAGARGQGDWVQICSAGGVAWVRLGAEAGTERTGGHSGDGQGHCPWCQLGDGAGLPTQLSAFDFRTPVDARAMVGTRDAVLQAPWPSALSRAPPLA